MSQLKEIFFNLSTGATGDDPATPKVVNNLEKITVASATTAAVAALALSNAPNDAILAAAVTGVLATEGAKIVGSYVGSGLAGLTKDNNSFLTVQSENTLRKTGAALLATFALACGGVVSHYAYEHEVAKDALQAKAAAGERPAVPTVK